VGIEVEGERHGHALAGWQDKGHIRGPVCSWAIYRTEQEAADQGPCTRSPAISASMTTGSPNSTG